MPFCSVQGIHFCAKRIATFVIGQRCCRASRSPRSIVSRSRPGLEELGYVRQQPGHCHYWSESDDVGAIGDFTCQGCLGFRWPNRVESRNFRRTVRMEYIPQSVRKALGVFTSPVADMALRVLALNCWRKRSCLANVRGTGSRVQYRFASGQLGAQHSACKSIRPKQRP